MGLFVNILLWIVFSTIIVVLFNNTWRVDNKDTKRINQKANKSKE